MFSTHENMQVIYYTYYYILIKNSYMAFKRIIEADYVVHPVCIGKKNTQERSRVKIKSNETHCLGS